VTFDFVFLIISKNRYKASGNSKAKKLVPVMNKHGLSCTEPEEKSWQRRLSGAPSQGLVWKPQAGPTKIMHSDIAHGRT
jgi:hypothetical protein